MELISHTHKCFTQEISVRTVRISENASTGDYSCVPYGIHVERGPDDAAELVDKNLIVQLAGDDPDILTKAGNLVQHDKNVVAVDLNLGLSPRRLRREVTTERICFRIKTAWSRF